MQHLCLISQCTEPRNFLVTKLMCTLSWQKTLQAKCALLSFMWKICLECLEPGYLRPTCETQSLCCFSYRQLPGLQGQVRAAQLCVRGWLVLSALNRLSRFNPSQQQSSRQPLTHCPASPIREGIRGVAVKNLWLKKKMV